MRNTRTCILDLHNIVGPMHVYMERSCKIQKSKQTNCFVLLIIFHQCRQQIGSTAYTSDQIPKRE